MKPEVPSPSLPEEISEDAIFEQLMPRRIRKVLLVCSNYDAFMLEEDGRIEEQIFNEYVSLNLRVIPEFTHADTAGDALRILRNEPIDLIIEMLSIRDSNSFELAQTIKGEFPGIPIVVLTHFSREVSLRLQNEDLSAIDYVFSWMGNADLLLAIIKLMEDRLNIESDTSHGVQAILLAEDSVRYASAYLPLLYKIIFTQTGELFKEGLNAHQKVMRMRGRPKVILANHLENALTLYQTYKKNLLGVISDVRFKDHLLSRSKAESGLILCRTIREEYPDMPILLQSSEQKYEEAALALNAGFAYKYSPGVQQEIGHFVLQNFAFGPFQFKEPETFRTIARADDLDAMQKVLRAIPDHVLLYHVTRNDISKWLNARGIFPLGRLFGQKSAADFDSAQQIRQFLIQGISQYRLQKGRGIVAQFQRERFNRYLRFSRIGEGSIGGKARGLAFADTMLKQHQMEERWQGVRVQIPDTVVISTDFFDRFIAENHLLETVLYGNLTDEEILTRFLQASLPDSLLKDLRVLMEGVRVPVAVRSSSLLEDSHFQPFAGIYATYMVPCSANAEHFAQDIAQAIKGIYASVYFSGSKAYMKASSNSPEEEKMAIILQQVCGSFYGSRFYPACSGVARSTNHYPVGKERPDEGVAFIGFGLGKYIVEGGTALRFSPRYPKHLLQLSNPQTALRETQKYFYALDQTKPFEPSVCEDQNLTRLAISDAEHDGSLRWVASTYNFETQTLTDGVLFAGKRIITFNNMLLHGTFPLPEILRELLSMGKREMGSDVEIEFAVQLNVNQGAPRIFHLLQIRPIPQEEQAINVAFHQIPASRIIASSTASSGNGRIDTLFDCIWVREKDLRSVSVSRIVETIAMLNARMVKEKRNYVLIGPGRWGTSDFSMGIPVKWVQISEARLVIETGFPGYHMDPSQGSHFFQHLNSFKVGYFTINQTTREEFIDLDYLKEAPVLYHDAHVSHIRFSTPMSVLINGKTNRGVLLKPVSEKLP